MVAPKVSSAHFLYSPAYRFVSYTQSRQGSTGRSSNGHLTGSFRLIVSRRHGILSRLRFSFPFMRVSKDSTPAPCIFTVSPGSLFGLGYTLSRDDPPDSSAPSGFDRRRRPNVSSLYHATNFLCDFLCPFLRYVPHPVLEGEYGRCDE